MEAPTVTYDLQLADHQALTAHVCASANAKSKRLARILALGGVLLVAMGASLVVESLLSFLFGALTMSLLLLVVMKLVMSDAQGQLQPTSGGSILCGHQMTITPEGVEIRTPFWHTTTRWPGVISIEETPNHLFFRIDKIAAYTVPKRAFGNELASRAFLEAARSYHAGPRD